MFEAANSLAAERNEYTSILYLRAKTPSTQALGNTRISIHILEHAESRLSHARTVQFRIVVQKYFVLRILLCGRTYKPWHALNSFTHETARSSDTIAASDF